MAHSRNATNDFWFQSGLALLTLAAALAIGWVAVELNPVFLVAPVVVLVALYVAGRPHWLLWTAVVGGLFVAGVARLYFPQIQQIRWLLIPIGALLLVYTALAFRASRQQVPSNEVPAIIWWAIAFFLVSLVANANSDFDLDRFLVGFKGYFQVWPLLLAIALYPWAASTMDKLPRVILVIAFLQLPFVLHQFFILVPKRVGMEGGIVAVDIVAGTFGASLEGGGATASLNAFLAIVFAGVLAARENRILSWPQVLVLSTLLLAPMLINMAKVSVFYLLAVLLVVYAGDALKRPSRFLGALAGSVLLAVILIGAFTLGAPSKSGIKTWQDLIAFTYQYNVADDYVSGTGTMSRARTLGYWFESHGLHDIRGALFGHGLGFTRVPDREFALRSVVRAELKGMPSEINLNQEIGKTGIAAVLWETGIVGVICLLGIVASNFLSAGRLARCSSQYPERAAALRAAQVGMVIYFITFWHKSGIVYDVVYQTSLVVLIGYVAYWQRNTKCIQVLGPRTAP